MKYKLKDIELDHLCYTITQMNNGKIINLKYNSETLEFQSPKVIIEEIYQENGKEYLLLKIQGTEACKKFFLKIMELEDHLNKNNKWSDPNFPKIDIEPLFKGETFKVKIPFHYSKPSIKVYSSDSNLFNYYHLSKKKEIICLLSLDKLWINETNGLYYNLTVKEIMVINVT